VDAHGDRFSEEWETNFFVVFFASYFLERLPATNVSRPPIARFLEGKRWEADRGGERTSKMGKERERRTGRGPIFSVMLSVLAPETIFSWQGVLVDCLSGEDAVAMYILRELDVCRANQFPANFGHRLWRRPARHSPGGGTSRHHPGMHIDTYIKLLRRHTRAWAYSVLRVGVPKSSTYTCLQLLTLILILKLKFSIARTNAVQNITLLLRVVFMYYAYKFEKNGQLLFTVER